MNTQIAQVLEDAADFILMRGLCRGELKDPLDRYCTIGAIYQVAPRDTDGVVAGCATAALAQHLRSQGALTAPHRDGSMSPLAVWSDASKDDFEVIDALRLCAKGIRNTASPYEEE